MSSTAVILMGELIGKHRCPRAKVVFETIVDNVDRFLLGCCISYYFIFYISPCLTIVKSFPLIFCNTSETKVAAVADPLLSAASKIKLDLIAFA